jgi:hypothetical protein
MGLEFLVAMVRHLLPGIKFIAFTTRSATFENQKTRVIIPLARLSPGTTYSTLQKILNDQLELAGIETDRATERVAQVCYLPNRGDYYQFKIEPGQPLDWEVDLAAELVAERARLKAAELALTERREQARLKAAERMATGAMSPIDAYNQAYLIEDCLLECKYESCGGQRWISPHSESGNPGVTLLEGNKAISHHESDAGIGKSLPGGGVLFDPFDLLSHFEFDGDRNAALKKVGSMFTVNGLTLTTANQRSYMESLNDPAKIFSSFAPVVANHQPESFDLTNFALNGASKSMELKMLEDKYVLGRMALLGQSTIFYAKPNAGKTLLTIWLICQKIKSGELRGSDVFYINADDTHKGLVHKLKLAEEHCFNMLAPGYSGFKTDHLPVYLEKMIDNETASGKVLVLDTAKKFADLMSKDKASKFGETVRQFVSHGGTVVMLAHTNKHRDEEKKLIYAGTSDLVDDADCAYTLDIVSCDPGTGLRTVVFENFKARGDSVREAFYRYNFADGTPYHKRLESVVAVGEDERQAALKTQRLATILERNQPTIDVIKDCIREGFILKTALIREASSRSGISKKRIMQVLKDHTGLTWSENHFWHLDVREKNAHVFELNFGVL